MRINLARIGIGMVILWNLQASLVFLIWPDRYTAQYELPATTGEAWLRGLGVLFVMWNIPYLVALWHPVQHRVSLYEALAMQIIGLVGEGWIYASLPVLFSTLRTSLLRFISFDALGFILLLFAAWITRENPVQE
jgi:hypothetical protein